MRLARSSALALLMIGGGLLVPAWFGLAGHPEHRVRTSPLLTHAGRIGSEAPLGQSFSCAGSGLRQIDLSLVRLAPPGVPLELVLREGDAAGRIVRRVTVLPDPANAQQLVPFRFDPLPDSDGLTYHFQVAPADGAPFADHSAWIRFHGQVGRNEPWGNQVLESPVLEAEFRSPLDNLRALAFACEDLSTARGEIRLELFEIGGDAEPLRVARLPPPAVVRGGFAFFSFPPLSASAERDYRCRLTSEGTARFVGRDGAPTFKTFHGQPGSRPGMGGMTSGSRPLPDRDLVFRAWSDYGPARGLRLVRERAGWRFWPSVLCWTASVLALVRMLAGVRSTWRSEGRGES